MDLEPNRYCKKDYECCKMAFALRPGKFTVLDGYIIGAIETDYIASLIHHNNMRHDGNTQEQIGRLCRIMQERMKTYPSLKYDVPVLTELIERKVHEMWRQVNPTSAPPIPLKMEPNQVTQNTQEHIDQQRPRHRNRRFLYSYQQSICEHAQAFLPKKNPDFDESMSHFLIGPLQLANIAKAFYHNNVFHQSSTVDQIGELVKVIESRKLYGEDFEKVKLIKNVMVAVEKIEIFYGTRGITPEASCVETDLDDIVLLPLK